MAKQKQPDLPPTIIRDWRRPTRSEAEALVDAEKSKQRSTFEERAIEGGGTIRIWRADIADAPTELEALCSQVEAEAVEELRGLLGPIFQAEGDTDVRLGQWELRLERAIELYGFLTLKAAKGRRLRRTDKEIQEGVFGDDLPWIRKQLNPHRRPEGSLEPAKQQLVITARAILSEVHRIRGDRPGSQQQLLHLYHLGRFVENLQARRDAMPAESYRDAWARQRAAQKRGAEMTHGTREQIAARNTEIAAEWDRLRQNHPHYKASFIDGLVAGLHKKNGKVERGYSIGSVKRARLAAGHRWR